MLATMLRSALLALLSAGCGAASPCIGATAAGERYCAIACDARERIACPDDLPHRTDAPGVAVCRAEEGPLSPAMCAQLPNGCEVAPTGTSGPRCSAASPFCLPEAYEGCAATTYRPGAARHLLDIGHADGACEHDGECVQAGCGNDCVAWDLAGGAGTCEGYTLSHPAYCGCVEGRCAWFAQ